MTGLVRFLPFWEPHHDYASSRLRALFPARALATAGFPAEVGWGDDASVYVVVQLCSDRTLDRLRMARRRGARIVYCVCDRHYANSGRSIAGVHTKWRFEQLAEIADALLSPTDGLRDELQSLAPSLPTHIIPDWLDYVDHEDGRVVEVCNRAVWFGNAGTGNFSAARPFLDLLEGAGISFSIIGNPRSFATLNDYADRTIPWRYDTFIHHLRNASFSLIAFDPAERQKSTNRFATSVVNGVPAILCGKSTSATCAIENGFGEIVVYDQRELPRAVACVQNPEFRRRYIEHMRGFFLAELGEQVMTQRYLDMFKQITRASH